MGATLLNSSFKSLARKVHFGSTPLCNFGRVGSHANRQATGRLKIYIFSHSSSRPRVSLAAVPARLAKIFPRPRDLQRRGR